MQERGNSNYRTHSLNWILNPEWEEDHRQQRMQWTEDGFGLPTAAVRVLENRKQIGGTANGKKSDSIWGMKIQQHHLSMVESLCLR